MNIEKLAKEAANNHAQFDSFCWHAAPEDAERWTIVYTNNRDSELREESNAAAIAKEMQEFLDADEPDIVSERHGHWACGWVEGYSIRVYRADGTITEAFKRYCELMECLEHCSVLDEVDFCGREYEATLKNIEQEGKGLLRDDIDIPDDWADIACKWFWDNDPGAVECMEGRGGYPSEEEMKACLGALGWLPAEDDEVVSRWRSLPYDYHDENQQTISWEK